MGSVASRLDTIETYDIGIADLKWRLHKRSARKVVVAFAAGGELKRAGKIKSCGRQLIFGHTADGERKLKSAEFCKDSLCPVCGWRKSLKRFAELKEHIEFLKAQGYKYFSHITFTLKNSFILEGSISRLWASWRKLSRRKWFKEMFDGAYCSIEFTFNPRTGWHPHMHCLVAWNKSFISRVGRGRLPMPETCWRAFSDFLSAEWLVITGDSYIVKPKGAKNLHEVTKYITKFEYFDGADGGERVVTLAKEIRNRRLYCKSGVFKSMKIDENPDLVHIDEDSPGEQFVSYEVWDWDEKLADYKRRVFSIEEFDNWRSGKNERTVLGKKCVSL